MVKWERPTQVILDTLADIAAAETPPLEVLLADVKSLTREKWDLVLPVLLLCKAYTSLYLDLGEGLAWVRQVTGRRHS